MNEYIRFTTFKQDSTSKRPQGIFQACYQLKNNYELQKSELEIIDMCLEWFGINLETPKHFSRSKRTYAHPNGLSWYKKDANEHIKILKNHGIEVEIIQTDKPGYVVYEDEFQVVAEPFQNTIGTSMKKMKKMKRKF